MMQKMMMDMMADSDEYDSESEQEIDIKSAEVKNKKHGIFDVNTDDFMDKFKTKKQE